ncbi:MAG: hypothetical protein KJ749_12005, partial [Planctomycetes bacterium]|nr:hypothetical protein [Planctomycetota bacterium]
DQCDIINCDGSLSCADCNSNTIPDGCETDCDGNGIPDSCVPPPDSDNDGLNDCQDRCPLTTPLGKCFCPPTGECCWPQFEFCLPNYPPSSCQAMSGVPECLSLPCRQGCLLGDANDDGDLDLHDFAVMQRSFTGPAERPDYVEPLQDYWLVFDFEDDIDIDLGDFQVFEENFSGP